jgi:lipoprotein-anchoring transpeptidase ErfK/SrfK
MTSDRRLFYVLGNGHALSYPVAVGKGGKTWVGVAHVDGKYLNPAWSPPDEIRRDKPNLPSVIPGGSPQNPMGVAALTLTPGDYAIHGTNAPSSIGRYASYGCIRMFNRDIIDLYRRVSVGAKVVVLK